LRVSVIVTTYDNPKALSKVLDGLSLQRRPPDEVIVADDGSGPETAGAVERAKRESGLTIKIKHVWHEDKGFRAAKIRNEALKQAKGEYIIFTDGDCVPNRHYVADHLALSERGHFVQGKRVLLDSEGSEAFNARRANSTAELIREFMGGHLGNAHHILRIPFLPVSRSTSMRGIKTSSFGVFREDVMAVNGFNEAFTGWGREDSEFAARLYRYGLKRKEHPFAAVCFHLWHPQQPRESLARNEALLADTLASEGYRCRRGIAYEDEGLGK
jgi:glycosyltransferase involved in cell wall biosynthesis